MSEGKIWVGLDLGERFTNVCMLDDNGKAKLEKVCPSSLMEVEAALSAYPTSQIAQVAVEAGSATYLVRDLLGRGYPVCIYEARKARKFLTIRGNKTDSSDARGLADIGRLGQGTVSKVRLKSLECQELRSQLVMRHKLVQMRVAADSSLRSRLALHGRRLTTTGSPGMLRKGVEPHLHAIRGERGLDLSAELRPLVELCEGLRSCIADMDKLLGRAAKQHPVCKRFMEVPGVGPICALSFYSAIEDPHRFRRVTDVGAYLGLTPKRSQSGAKSLTLGITKMGSKLTRTHLVTAATILRRHGGDCALKVWGDRATERIGLHRARVGLARKLAVVLLAMWRTGEHFRSQQA